MRINRIWSLIVKDLQIHGRGIALALGGFLLFILFVVKVVASARPAFTPAACATLVFNVNFLGASFLWGDWLISREKTKGTFAWLRSLPIPDRTVVRSKLVGGIACTSALWLLSTLIFSRRFFFPDRCLTWVVVLFSLSWFTILSFGCRWVFRQKAGTILPIAFVVALIMIPFAANYLGLGWTTELIKLWTAPFGPALAIVVLLALCLAAWAGLESWVARTETYRLLE